MIVYGVGDVYTFGSRGVWWQKLWVYKGFFSDSIKGYIADAGTRVSNESKGRNTTKPDKDVSQITCWYCQQKGHYKSDCPLFQKAKKHEHVQKGTNPRRSGDGKRYVTAPNATSHAVFGPGEKTVYMVERSQRQKQEPKIRRNK